MTNNYILYTDFSQEIIDNQLKVKKRHNDLNGHLNFSSIIFNIHVPLIDLIVTIAIQIWSQDSEEKLLEDLGLFDPASLLVYILIPITGWSLCDSKLHTQSY